MQAWKTVFTAFADDEGNGTVLVEGSPKDFIGDAQELIGDLKNVAEDCTIPLSNITESDVYAAVMNARRR